MKAAFYTLGCKVNQYDTNAMQELLQQDGYEIVPFDEAADVYVINTCTVTNTADKKSRNMIRRAKKLNKDAVVCVCGCLAQREAEAILNMEGVSAVIGTADRANVASIVRQARSGQQINAAKPQSNGEVFEELTVSSGGELTRGYIKIQEGCNNFCSYCIIPYVRGRVRSRKAKNIIDEASRMASSGVKEIVLTGIHISSFGIDSGEKLIEMLRNLNAVDGIERIRLGSMEPHILQKEFLNELVTLEKVCPHFHVSLQSGSDSVLKAMNRKYTAAQFAQWIANARAAYDAPAITTDIITGFPGETAADFLQSVSFAKEMRFSKVHVFPYSERKGTPAAEMEHAVPMQERKKRANELILAARETEHAYIDGFLNTHAAVLFEEEEDGGAAGYTDRYIRVFAKGAAAGDMKTVLLNKRQGETVFGATD